MKKEKENKKRLILHSVVFVDIFFAFFNNNVLASAGLWESQVRVPSLPKMKKGGPSSKIGNSRRVCNIWELFFCW